MKEELVVRRSFSSEMRSGMWGKVAHAGLGMDKPVATPP